MRAVVDPLSRLGLPALSRPAPAVVPFFPFEMTGGSWPPVRESRRAGGAGPGRRAAALCLVLGCVVAVAGIAEVLWEVPGRPLLLAGNLFEECMCGEQSPGFASHSIGHPLRAGWPVPSGWSTRRVASLFFLPARWLKPSQRPWEDTCGAEIDPGERNDVCCFCGCRV